MLIMHCFSVARNEGDSRRRSQPYPSSGPIGLGGSAPKMNRSYAFQARGGQEHPPNVAPGMCFILYLDCVVACLLWLDRLNMIDFVVFLSMNGLHYCYVY